MNRKDDTKIIPEDMRTKFTPEMIQFTLTELETKGLIEFIEGGYTPTKKAQELFKKIEVEKEEIIAWGHPNITAKNKTKIKITKENEPLKDDSIIGVKANKSCSELKNKIKERLKLSQNIKITISVDGLEDKIAAFGSPALELTNNKDIVIKKSDTVDGKTLAILSDKAAYDLKEKIIKKLKSKNKKIKISLEI
jgi:hypothetical protein